MLFPAEVTTDPNVSLYAGVEWLVDSGIQDIDGGVHRLFDADTGCYAPISAELTAYVAHAAGSLWRTWDDQRLMQQCQRGCDYLLGMWQDGFLPYAPGSLHSYLFDTAMVSRCLSNAGVLLQDRRYLHLARETAEALYAFRGHPVMGREGPLKPKGRWSTSPGCYQLKCWTAWFLFEDLVPLIDPSLLKQAVADSKTFLDDEDSVNRLHPYCYFLEGLLPIDERWLLQYGAILCHGIRTVAARLRNGQWERSDVYAQLLRLRLYAHVSGLTPLNVEEASWELNRLLQFQCLDSSERETFGAFWFGYRDGKFIRHANPCSTTFALQAIQMWKQCETKRLLPEWRWLV